MADSFKLSTFIWIAAGLLVPLWPISLPICFYFAYRSFKDGTPPSGSLTDLQTAVELHKSGNLSDEELRAIRAKSLVGRT
ncbi:hypothetical protein [Rhizobium etli]|uniref:hypothetical protein n=1 Tax=Rhizobium etli TaxID=29449 RepID=UPI0002D4A3C1|nr:hypothetical protein [Rhizobium etli]